jgi:hypothetical protein
MSNGGTLDDYIALLGMAEAQAILNTPDAEPVPGLHCEAFPETTGPAKKQVKPLAGYRSDELYQKQLDRPPVIIDGLLPAGLTVLAGPPKRGKSWMALLMGISVAQGTPFLGMQTKQGDVLYLDLESRQYRIQDRLSKILPGAGPHSLMICHESSKLDEDLLPQIELWCTDSANTKPALVIIDTLGRIKGASKRGETAYEADTRILGEVQGFAQNHKIAVVLVHHLRKTQTGMGANDDFFEKISGSMGITGACDCVMVLSGKRGEEDTTLHVNARDFDPSELILNFKAGIWTLKSTDSEAYREEQEYVQSPVVRAVIAMMRTRERWEGTPSNLMGELCYFESFDIKPESMSKELQRFRERLQTREGIIVKLWRNRKSRMVAIDKVSENSF